LDAGRKSLLDFKKEGPITVGIVANSSMLDGMVVSDFGRELVAYIESHPGMRLLLDFENVDYLSSAALTELIRANDAAVATGGSALRICGLSADIQKVFEITKFDRLFDIHPGEDRVHALARYKRALEISEEEDAWDKRRS
jgi:anti-sigma B factor antagonist